jgi:hypothetical protein
MITRFLSSSVSGLRLAMSATSWEIRVTNGNRTQETALRMTCLRINSSREGMLKSALTSQEAHGSGGGRRSASASAHIMIQLGVWSTSGPQRSDTRRVLSKCCACFVTKETQA